MHLRVIDRGCLALGGFFYYKIKSWGMRLKKSHTPTFVLWGRDPVELAKRAKQQPPAMRVRDDCYTKNHLSVIMRLFKPKL